MDRADAMCQDRRRQSSFLGGRLLRRVPRHLESCQLSSAVSMLTPGINAGRSTTPSTRHTIKIKKIILIGSAFWGHNVDTRLIFYYSSSNTVVYL